MKIKNASIVLITTMCTLACTFSSLSIYAQDKPKAPVTADITAEDGLETVSFDTLNGFVEVALPDDLADSDTLSGTVIAEPKGETQEEVAENQAELNGYVVEVAKTEEVKEPPVAVKEPPASLVDVQKPSERNPASIAPYVVPPVIVKTPPCINVSAEDHAFTCLVPPATGYFTIILKTKSGKEVCRQSVRAGSAPKPTRPISASNPPTCQFPAQGTCGKSLTIPGKCDGRSATSKVKVNGRVCRVLAESPRRQIVRTPKDCPGECTIESSECGYVRRGKIKLLPYAKVARVSPSQPVAPRQPVAVRQPPVEPRKVDGYWMATFTTTSMTNTDYRGTRSTPPNPPYSIPVALVDQGSQLLLSGSEGELGPMQYTGSWNGTSAVLQNRFTNARGSLKTSTLSLNYDRSTDTFNGEFERREDTPRSAPAYSGLGSPSQKGGAASSVNRGTIQLKRQ